jgi:phage terminase large subunit-like protein
MPWQRLVADIGLELFPGTMIPAYREVVITVPRQNGKTTLMLAWEIQRALGWSVSQRIAYTAQTGKDAREKLINDQAPLIDPAMPPRLPVKAGVKRVSRGVGNESVLFKTGSRIILLNSGDDSGHGKTLDLGVIDESFADEDDRREQAMLPAMLTRPSAQILNISTAGTEKSAFLKRKVDTGRAAVDAGVTSGMAYFEWSAGEDADIDDEATWWSCMPALGYTQTIEAVRHARLTMPEGDFRRACLNQWTISEERVIPAAVWNAVCSESLAPDRGLVIGLDVNPERSAAAIAIADNEGRCELVKFAEGVGWVVAKASELAKKWEAPVAFDTYGGAASLIPEIEAKGVVCHGYSSREMAAACGNTFDAIADRKIQIRRNPDLDIAAAGVRKRSVGDTWIWGRNSDKDVSPLMALTLAYDKAITSGRTSDLWFATD